MTPDREALIHAIELRESIAKRDHHGFVDFTYEMVGDVLALLKGQPEIIRCKDCKFYQKPEYGFTKGDCTYGSVWYQTEEDGFCSKAKVKD